eukprot:TRINITY_DN20381_c0_g1_i2.p1 TRINITY_DN20381_c0_g1~~TRINITY_DN20381_c0_g1_i2.p1  ORF type:complete len:729 (+),score=143.95 TRINITY_DN20381_c0_g1_i2:89-2275(+)
MQLLTAALGAATVCAMKVSVPASTRSGLQLVEDSPDNASENVADSTSDNASDGTSNASNAEQNESSYHTYGDPRCPCIGLANVPGIVNVSLGSDKYFPYPAEFGARCNAWDDGRNPDYCMEGQDPGTGKGWCAEPYCFVDPCNCHMDSPPGENPEGGGYFPDGRFQAKPVWYSYATCGGRDFYRTEEELAKKFVPPKECEEDFVESIDETKWGKRECACIGLARDTGYINASIGDGDIVAFNSSLGSRCEAWESGVHPDCKSENESAEVPDWCEQAWCFVDPCSCSLDVPPKASGYVPNATYQGRPVYWSYATCGGADTYSASKNKKACVNQKEKEDCEKADRCAWENEVCISKEIAEVCQDKTIANETQDDEEDSEEDAEEDKEEANYTIPEPEKPPSELGWPGCHCIGLANISGAVNVSVGHDRTHAYAISIGSVCDTWDDNSNPVHCMEDEDQNPGAGNKWCAQPWCYVDPCSCNLTHHSADKPHAYTGAFNSFPDATFQGKDLHFSYATCGGKDYWIGNARHREKKTPEEQAKVCEDVHKEKWPSKWGKEECKCIGIANQNGFVNMSVTVNGSEVEVPYSSDTGSSCQAWDRQFHPSCQKKKKKSASDDDGFDEDFASDSEKYWCDYLWCYVDPCSCSLEVAPKKSTYLPEATFQHHSLHVSMHTCSENDFPTEVKTCVDAETADDCAGSNAVCLWTGTKCIHGHFQDMCFPELAKQEKDSSVS